jgi:hypothetical protein
MNPSYTGLYSYQSKVENTVYNLQITSNYAPSLGPRPLKYRRNMYPNTPARTAAPASPPTTAPTIPPVLICILPGRLTSGGWTVAAELEGAVAEPVLEDWSLVGAGPYGTGCALLGIMILLIVRLRPHPYIT